MRRCRSPGKVDARQVSTENTGEVCQAQAEVHEDEKMKRAFIQVELKSDLGLRKVILAECSNN